MLPAEPTASIEEAFRELEPQIYDLDLMSELAVHTVEGFIESAQSKSNIKLYPDCDVTLFSGSSASGHDILRMKERWNGDFDRLINKGTKVQLLSRRIRQSARRVEI